MAQLRVGLKIRQDPVAGSGSLLVGVRVPDEAGFAPGFTQETEAEPGYIIIIKNEFRGGIFFFAGMRWADSVGLS